MKINTVTLITNKLKETKPFICENKLLNQKPIKV